MNSKVVLVLVVFAFFGIFKIAHGGSSIMNKLTVKNEELYKPILSESFSLHEKGNSGEFNLNYKYKDTYSFGITNADIGFPDDYDFNGLVKLEFFANGEKVSEQTVNEQDVKWYLQNSGNRYKQITLGYFKIPVEGKYKKDLSIKVTVLEPDTRIKEFGDTVNIVIGVSATP